MNLSEALQIRPGVTAIIGGGVLQAILEYTGVLSNVTGQNAWEV